MKLREASDVSAPGLAEARHVLARALVAAGEPKGRAVALARRAREVYEGVGDAHRHDLAEVNAFLAEHRDSR